MNLSIINVENFDNIVLAYQVDINTYWHNWSEPLG